MSKNYFGYMIEELKTIKLELDGGKEIYVMYEKPEVNKYVVSIYAKSKDEGNMIHQFGLSVKYVYVWIRKMLITLLLLW